MNKFNSRKIAIIAFIAVGLGSMTVAYQNFTAPASQALGGESQSKKDSDMSDALSAAMQSAEEEHVQKQMAMNVEPGQLEKSMKKVRKVTTVQLESSIGADTEETARAIKPAKRSPASSDNQDDDFLLEDSAGE